MNRTTAQHRAVTYAKGSRYVTAELFVARTQIPHPVGYVRELTGLCSLHAWTREEEPFLLPLSDTEAVRKQSGHGLPWTGCASGLDLKTTLHRSLFHGLGT